MPNDEESTEKDAKIKSAKEVLVMKVAKDVQPYVKDVDLCIKDEVERLNLVKDIEEIKMKLRELESTLGMVSAEIPSFFTLLLFNNKMGTANYLL